jgi:hypothetical protein
MEISQVNGQMKSAKLQGSSSTQKKQEHATYYYYELHTKNATAKNLPAATGPHLPGNLGGGAGERAKTLSWQITGQRADSVHLVEKLCPFYLLDIQRHSWRASGQEGPRGIGSGCEVHSARTRHNTNCIKRGNIKRAQGCCPWSPPQGGARDQSASARRGLPSKGEARALHHQPRPSIDLDHALPLLSSAHWLLDH